MISWVRGVWKSAELLGFLLLKRGSSQKVFFCQVIHQTTAEGSLRSQKQATMHKLFEIIISQCRSKHLSFLFVGPGLILVGSRARPLIVGTQALICGEQAPHCLCCCLPVHLAALLKIALQQAVQCPPEWATTSVHFCLILVGWVACRREL